MALHLSSPEFHNGASIPPRFTCEGDDLPPPLHWEGEPAGTKSFALIVEDPDAPDPRHPQRTFIHWVLYNLPPNIHTLTEAMHRGKLPKGAREGLNDWNRPGYGGPCPPIGRHRYFHRLYALDTVLPELGSPTRDELLRAMDGHILAQSELIGTYEKQH
ncbi:MAG TPA: YbhB/YbcL family Raf kinase inhibitor-like protein [Myxococcaceae bacterium]|nr:YbhB/YbcL family Raf kinase inhibitor-like protein [Myxococcaceae bacterium]